MARASLPPGFRFHPTDVELILYYLKRKVLGKRLVIDAITELDLYKFSPWDLPDKSCLQSRDLEWYFFCPKDKKYAQGARTNRATEIGYWKTTGRDRAIYNETQTVGMKKTLIFHLGRAPLGERTNWVMHEYRLTIKDWIDAGISQDSYVLCKIFEKSGAGPKNGEQHGAPFNEEEWENDFIENSFAPLPFLGSCSSSIIQDHKMKNISKNSTLHLEKTLESSLQHPRHVSSDTTGENNQPMVDNVDMDYIFALLEAENDPDLKQNGTDQLNFTNMEESNVFDQTLLGNDMAYVELDDFDSPMKYSGNGNGPKHIQYEKNITLSSENVGSIRLSDLDVPEKYPWEANSENFFLGDQFHTDTEAGLESFCFPFVPMDSNALSCNLDDALSSTTSVGSSGFVENSDLASNLKEPRFLGMGI